MVNLFGYIDFILEMLIDFSMRSGCGYLFCGIVISSGNLLYLIDNTILPGAQGLLELIHPYGRTNSGLF